MLSPDRSTSSTPKYMRNTSLPPRSLHEKIQSLEGLFFFNILCVHATTASSGSAKLIPPAERDQFILIQGQTQFISHSFHCSGGDVLRPGILIFLHKISSQCSVQICPRELKRIIILRTINTPKLLTKERK